VETIDTTAPHSGISRDDMYQMASYASGYECEHITLLYPSSDEIPPGLVDTFTLSDAKSSCVDVFALNLHGLVRGAPLPIRVGPEVPA
jgi:5-methylcytosine-specific restriction endonuclease McrBC regulatory subunit McrC